MAEGSALSPGSMSKKRSSAIARFAAAERDKDGLDDLAENDAEYNPSSALAELDPSQHAERRRHDCGVNG